LTSLSGEPDIAPCEGETPRNFSFLQKNLREIGADFCFHGLFPHLPPEWRCRTRQISGSIAGKQIPRAVCGLYFNIIFGAKAKRYKKRLLRDSTVDNLWPVNLAIQIKIPIVSGMQTIDNYGK
jgi:hypothetical protein